MKNNLHYTEISKLSQYRIFKKYVQEILVETIESFFNCNVIIYTHPAKIFLEEFNIDIHQNNARGFYPIDESNLLLLGRIFKNKTLISSVGFKLSGLDVERTSKLLNVFERALTHFLTSEFSLYFENSSIIFGDEIIKKTMATYISKGGYDARQIRHLIEYFFKLRTTSFEGRYFSTGAIFTKTHNFLTGKFDSLRHGHTFGLEKPFHISITNNINKRIWYLVDGKTSFFLGNKNLNFRSIFTINSQYAENNFIDSHSLSLTLKGGDFLIKVENEKLMSINLSGGDEFLFFENKWKFRNYTHLKNLLLKNINSDIELVDSILFYIITCSKSQISTILWFPEDLKNIDCLINPKTKNSFLKEKINIKNKHAIKHLLRCISSDGACVFSNTGILEHIGVIVNLENAKASGMTGTGETAAAILKQNGLAIKVSQDGLIKIFTKNNDSAYIF